MVASAGSRSGRTPALAKYDVLEELGHGGMATVYRACDRRLLRDVAVKVLHPHLRESREIAHRFSVEAKAVAKLRHPNIVEVFDVSSDDETEQYLVVELVRGPTLRRILQERGPLPPEIGAAFVMELLSGIVHAHALGVVHRDVKPENVLVEHRRKNRPSQRDEEDGASEEPNLAADVQDAGEEHLGASSDEGERIAVKLTDFGIAKLLDAQGVTSTGQVLGSPAHMAPEQIEGGEVDGRADIFSLGVLFYECLVGHLPFLGNNPAQVLRRVLDGVYASAERERPIIGKVWSQIIDRALARQVSDRYPDAQAMRDAISGELARIGMKSPKRELEAWLDDPDGWTADHDKRLIDKLCKLGASARKRSDAVAAAADYNRALAYAPNDPSLLRIVVSMHRSEARARLLRKVTPLILSAGLLGSGAYFVASTFKKPLAERNAPSTSTSVEATASAASTSRVVPPRVTVPPNASSSSGTASSATPAGHARVVATPTVAASSSRGVTRTVQFASLRPSFGVHMTIDGAPSPDPDPTRPFTLDDKAHTLVFTCAGDLCTPKTVQIPEGDKNVELQIELAIANAKLVVEGDPSHSYGITEIPSLNIAGGSEIEIPMNGAGIRQVHVFDRNDPSSAPLSVMLTAGKRASVSFKR